MSEIFTKISELGYGSPGTPLQVRILRTWTPQIRSHETWFLAVDKYGNAIQILGRGKDQGFVQSALIPSKCYTIAAYACGEADIFQKWLDNPIYIAVGMASSITYFPNTLTIPTSWFNFISKNQIPDYVDQCPDFLGVFVRLVNCTKRNKEPYLLLILENDFGQEIAISLWKDCTDVPAKFNRSAIENAPVPTILAVTNVKIATVAGLLRLGTSNATHIYMNPDIRETTALLDRYKANAASITSFGPPTPLLEINKKNHLELSDQTFTAQASIIDYTFTNTWYQIICPDCKKPTLKQGKNWFCPSDGILSSPISLYKLVATINDQTDSMAVTLSDNAAKKLFGTTSDMLIEEDDPDHRKNLPPIINDTKGVMKKMTLRMTKTLNNSNICFILTEIEDNTTEQSPTITTPHPHTPTTFDITNKPTTSSSQQQPVKVRKTFTFEEAGTEVPTAEAKRQRHPE
ncbi:unnamed protein product [Lactuca virosa]|uniref:Replication factor A C-terminal domain-containing protein n=1 Tax=Lactuca virosa TaxID=75947 RepID=A0AAU9MLC5_9ASTR|nr:unnamed protein product [Lactuca virosa]